MPSVGYISYIGTDHPTYRKWVEAGATTYRKSGSDEVLVVPPSYSHSAAWKAIWRNSDHE